jgi:hypothetical protein
LLQKPRPAALSNPLFPFNTLNSFFDDAANGPFPAGCADFNQLGMRVPLIAVSPFSKPH